MKTNTTSYDQLPIMLNANAGCSDTRYLKSRSI